MTKHQTVMNRALAEAGKSTKSAVLKPSIITSKAVFWRFFYKLEPIRYSARKLKRYNARLRGWQRTAELKKHTVNAELQFCTKTATRWQSLLSRLLCKFNEINRIYTTKSHDCNGWVIQEPPQTRTVINEPPKQSPPFSNKPSFWIRKT